MSIKWKQDSSLTQDGAGPQTVEERQTIIPDSIVLPEMATDIAWPDFVQSCQQAWLPDETDLISALPPLKLGTTVNETPVWELFNGATLSSADFSAIWYPLAKSPWFTTGIDWWESAAILSAATALKVPAAVRTARSGEPVAQRLLTVTQDNQRIAWQPDAQGAQIDPTGTADPANRSLPALGWYTTLAYIWHTQGRPNSLTFVTAIDVPAISQAVEWGRANGYPWHTLMADPRYDEATIEQWLRHVQVEQNYTLGADAAVSLATAEHQPQAVVLANRHPYCTADVVLSAVTNREHPHDAFAAAQILGNIIALPQPRLFRKMRRAKPEPLPFLTPSAWNDWLDKL